MNPTDEITIRRLGPLDEAALRRLAARDSAAVPAGELLGAEIDGRLLAAMPLTGGGAIADPFVASAAAVRLLEMRAAQIRGEGGGEGRRERRGLRELLRPARNRARSRGALAGSPPGGGGRLLEL